MRGNRRSPHCAVAAATHAEPQPGRLVDLHHPGKGARKAQATAGRIVQLDDELERRVPRMTFHHCQSSWRGSDKHATSSATSTGTMSTSTTPHGSTLSTRSCFRSCGGGRSGAPRRSSCRRRWGLSSALPLAIVEAEFKKKGETLGEQHNPLSSPFIVAWGEETALHHLEATAHSSNPTSAHP
jgi:hypothetical protein